MSKVYYIITPTVQYNYMEEMQVNDIGTAKHLVLVLSLEISPLHCNDKTLKLEME